MQIKMTRAEVEEVRGKLKAQGIVVSGDHATLQHDGCTVELDYDEPNTLMTITVLKKPFMLSKVFVEQKTAQLIEDAEEKHDESASAAQ